MYAIRYVCAVHVPRIYPASPPCPVLPAFCKRRCSLVEKQLCASREKRREIGKKRHEDKEEKKEEQERRDTRAKKERERRNGKDRDCKSLRMTGLSPSPRVRDTSIFSAVGGIFLTAARATNYPRPLFRRPRKRERARASVSGPIKG